MKATAELKMLPVSVLKPAAYNPRKKLKPGDKEYEKIKNSITEFGFADPLVVNADMTIIGGHQRLTVAMELGYTEVPCAVVDIDKTREKALNIALNKSTGAWDDSLLADLLKDIEDSNFDLGKTGFEPPEIETLFNKVHSKEVKEDDFDVESELKQPCFSKEGDLWHLGKHIVLCGDSTKPECYDTLMDGTKANLVLSDPPYNVDVEETAGKILNDNMGDSEFYQFLLAAFQQMHGHLADDGSIYIFHADTEVLNFINGAVETECPQLRIIEPELFEQAQELRQARTCERGGTSLGTSSKALLTGLVYVLTNPPFGKKSSITFTNEEEEQEEEDLVYNRQDFWTTSSNKQLNFIQHINTILKPTGKAAVVVPDNNRHMVCCSQMSKGACV